MQGNTDGKRRAVRALMTASAIAFTTFGVQGALAVGEPEGQQVADPDRTEVAALPGPNSPEAKRAREYFERLDAIKNSPEHRADRQDDARTDADETRTEAAATLRDSFPAIAEGDLWSPLGIDEGGRVLKYTGPYTATVTDGNDPVLLQSLLPLRAENGAGKLAPVDLTVKTDGDAFRPKNPLVDTTIHKDLSEGIEFDRLGVTVRLEGAESTSKAMTLDGKPFYANLLTDTDLLVVPTPTGVETLHTLRSPESPESVALELDLSPGQELRAVAGGELGSMAAPTGVRIVEGDRTISLISQPSAFDADGRTVPVTLVVDGTTLSMQFPHRAKGYRYPIVVDPVIDNYQLDPSTGNPSGPATDPFYYWGSFNQFGAQAVYPAAGGARSTDMWTYKGNNGATNALFILAPAGQQLNANRWSEWLWTAPNQSFIKKITFGSVGHTAYATCVQQGIWSSRDNKFEIGSVRQGVAGAPVANTSPWLSPNGAGNPCANLANDTKTHESNAPTPHNQAAFGLYSPYTFKLPANVSVSASLYGASIWLDDAESPTGENVERLFTKPGGSASATAPGVVSEGVFTARATVRDPGLGVSKLQLRDENGTNLAAALAPPDRTQSNATAPSTSYCTGGKDARCPTTWTPDSGATVSVDINKLADDGSLLLSDGARTLKLVASDPVGHETQLGSWTLEIDRGAPAIDASGPLFGGVPDPEAELELDEPVVLGSGDSQATLVGEDSDSGVRRLQLHDDQGTLLGTVNGVCAGTCESVLEGTLTVAASQLREGTRRLTVTATDLANNPTSGELQTVIVDRTPPAAPTNPQASTDGTITDLRWDFPEDPNLPDGSPGSGVAAFEYRTQRVAQAFTPWTRTDSESVEIANASAGEPIAVEVAAFDEAGNRSTTTAAVVLTTEAPRVDSGLTLDSESQAAVQPERRGTAKAKKGRRSNASRAQSLRAEPADGADTKRQRDIGCGPTSATLTPQGPRARDRRTGRTDKRTKKPITVTEPGVEIHLNVDTFCEFKPTKDKVKLAYYAKARFSTRVCVQYETVPGSGLWKSLDCNPNRVEGRHRSFARLPPKNMGLKAVCRPDSSHGPRTKYRLLIRGRATGMKRDELLGTDIVPGGSPSLGCDMDGAWRSSAGTSAGKELGESLDRNRSNDLGEPLPPNGNSEPRRGWQAHHMIAQTSMNAFAMSAQGDAYQCGVTPNQAINGVWLRGRDLKGPDGAFTKLSANEKKREYHHGGTLNSADYHQWVRRRITGACSPVHSELQDIRVLLRGGKYSNP